MEIETVGSLTRFITAMLTPVILILATSSILNVTSLRLSKALERTRRLWEQLLHFPEVEGNKELEMEAKNHLSILIRKVTRRAKLLQKAMIMLYFSLSLFVGTSIAIGTVVLSKSISYWVPVIMEILGFSLLFSSTVLLILEAGIALKAVKQETTFILNIDKFKREH